MILITLRRRWCYTRTIQIELLTVLAIFSTHMHDLSHTTKPNNRYQLNNTFCPPCPGCLHDNALRPTAQPRGHILTASAEPSNPRLKFYSRLWCGRFNLLPPRQTSPTPTPPHPPPPLGKFRNYIFEFVSSDYLFFVKELPLETERDD